VATLVLSTVGTVFGGPVGSAIGALIGQSIDQELLAPTRRGPRVGDLNVQTSSYGTQIPRIYGAMRVAGSVIWSTDLIETTQTGGVKGGPDVTFSYSVSMAVALSSRQARRIGRVWADGKLLRGAAGDLKVGGELRFLDGGEDQAIDPLIASIEGIANTPAYRGMALAVFENLQLADFGNRIPFLTFEVFADDESPLLGSVLSDASRGAVSSDSAQSVTGYAAYGATIRSAIEPLIDCFDVELFDDGCELRSPSNDAPTPISASELGNSADTNAVPRFEREQIAAVTLPSSVRLTYYDPARDYQSGEARASAGEGDGVESRQELPAVLNASDAKSLAQEMIARSWSGRDRLSVRLPPSRLSLQPGTRVRLPLSPTVWTVQKTVVEGFVVVAQLRPSFGASIAVPADGGRIVPNPDVAAGPLTLALFDIPNVLAVSANSPALVLAATTSTTGWKRSPVEIAYGGQTLSAQVARTKSLLGRARTVLADGAIDLIDTRNSVDVDLIDVDQWLTSCDDEALAAGENFAVLGDELIQFGQVLALGGGRFRLSRLLRGRGGTEWACADHGSDEPFCLIESGALQPIVLPAWAMGASVSGTSAGALTTVPEFRGEGVRPPAPVRLGAERQPNGDLLLNWTRRSRQGFAWVDEIDAPLGEAIEQYRVTVIGMIGSVELSARGPSLIIPGDVVVSLGAGSAKAEVRQVGDLAASRPAQINFVLS